MEIEIYLDGSNLKSNIQDSSIELLLRILQEKSLDRAVMNALRGYGISSYAGDVTFSHELDDEDMQKINIPEGMILVSETEEFSNPLSYLLNENIYFQILIKYCNLFNRPERAKIIYEYSINRNIANNLVEANPEICLKRWYSLIPFLEHEGWKIEGEFIKSPFGYSYNIKFQTTDLDVIYHESLNAINKVRDVRYINTWLHIVHNSESFVRAILAFKASEKT